MSESLSSENLVLSVKTTIYLDQYHSEIDVVVTNDLQALLWQHFAYLFPNGKAETVKVDGITIYNTETHPEPVIYLPMNAEWPVIAHECLHASWLILDAIGIEVTVDNHEVLAYTQQYLAEEIAYRWEKLLDRLLKKVQKINKKSEVTS